jgi:hypothetical protein
VSEEPAAGRELPATEPLPARAEGTDGAPAEVGALVPHGHLGRRNDRLLLAAVASYAVILSVLMIARGISVTPELIVIAFGLAALLLGRGKLFVRDWIPFLALFFAYELMRGYADKFGLPIHVTDVVSIERIIGLGGLPTTWLQGIFHSGPVWTQANPVYDNVATLSVVFYFLHFPLPLAVGFLLWIHHRRSYYDYVAALILLSMAAYVTFLLLPVAPPWWAAQNGYVTGVLHLRDTGFNGLVSLFGFGKNNYLYSYSLYSISSNDVAAFPSLHAAYPFLAFLFARRAFGRAGWLMAAYTACVWFSIVYLGEHWVVDIIGLRIGGVPGRPAGAGVGTAIPQADGRRGDRSRRGGGRCRRRWRPAADRPAGSLGAGGPGSGGGGAGPDCRLRHGRAWLVRRFAERVLHGPMAGDVGRAVAGRRRPGQPLDR